MFNKIATIDQQELSPFDSIRRIDSDGEFWLGREVMPLLGYKQWRQFSDAIERAIVAQENSGNPVGKNFLRTIAKTDGRPKEDYRLSRLGAYLTAMNGDPRKPEIALAQTYFAVKTREAEIIIPAQSDRLRELELINENLKLKSSLVSLHGKELALLLMGHADQVVETKVTVTEVVEPATGFCREILTADQLKKVVKQRTGQNIKSLTWFADQLRRANRDDLLVAVTRHTTSEYPIPDRLEEALDVVYGKERQRLIGE
ncbi:MAG: BRO family protein [Cetobacterium sp.]